MFRLDLSISEDLEDSLSRGLIQKGMEREAEKAKAELVEATPVDTGFARDHWELTAQGDNEILIENEAEYVKYLNQGSSKQAPSHFIENIVIKYGTPVGPITEEK